MKKFDKKLILLILIALALLTNSFLIYKANELHSAKIEKYNLTYLESEAPRLIQNYVNDRTFNAELLSCHIFVQNNQVFAFFDYKPLEGNAIIHKMPEDVIERCLFYGYAKIDKKFSKYSIGDFGVSFHDKKMEIKGASVSGSSRGQQYCYYGKILDNDVDKIEFYEDDILARTFYVGDKNYFFVELDSTIGNIGRRFYDKENRLLYE